MGENDQGSSETGYMKNHAPNGVLLIIGGKENKGQQHTEKKPDEQPF